MKDQGYVHSDILDQVSVLQLLQNYSLFSVPAVVAFDPTSRNAIGQPYTLHEFVQGTRLDDLWKLMSYEERRDVVDQTIDVLQAMDSIEFSCSGRLCRDKKQHERSATFSLSTPEEKSINRKDQDQDISIKGFGTDQLPSARETIPEKDLFPLLKEQFKQQLEKAKELDAAGRKKRPSARPYPIIAMFEKLQQVTDEMEELGFYDAVCEPRNVLHHMDFEPRNLSSCQKTRVKGSFHTYWGF